MSDKPHILCEVGARMHGAVILLFFAVAWVAAVAFALAFPVPGWWAVLWIAAATLTLAIAAGKALPLMVHGGTYRVVIQGPWLRAESPHPALGPGFTVALSAITRLVVQSSSEGPDRYEVHTHSGETFPLGNGVGEGIFKAIRQVRPEIPIERHG
jgi:hypothetical protein